MEDNVLTRRLATVRVSSLIHAPRLARGWAQQVVSILDPHIAQADIPRASVFTPAEHRTWFFQDSDNPARGPSIAAVVQILNFVQPDTRVLVHCHAGMSRSPSIAIGILIARGVPAHEAMRHIFAQNLIDHEGSVMEPNELILRHLNQRLGQDDLVALCRREMMR